MTDQNQAVNIKSLHRNYPSPLVAYFCMEFALDSEFGIYSGGLGVLAGDVLLEANHGQRSFVGVGLYYSLTYQQQILENGQQVE